LTKEEFVNIFNNNFDTVRNYIYYRCGDVNLATDVAQDTFIKVWEKRSRFNDDNVKGLLFKISRDIFISAYRKKVRETDFNFKQRPEQIDESPLDILQYEELKTNYNKLLKSMPEKQRVVFLMHRMDNLKYAEIASALGLSQKAIEKRMKLALDFLKKHIKN
jgi:RNA polymerase sigma-70 factor (ECF subfamily)